MSSILERPVLVLNKNYIPVRLVTVKRAVCKIFTNSYMVVENFQGEVVKTSSYDFPVPKIVLTKNTSLPKKKTRFTKLNVLMRDDYTCAYCGKKFDLPKLNIDHIIPKSRWADLDDKHRMQSYGVSNWYNVVSACKKCNTKKGNKLLEELGWTLKVKPRKPDISPVLLHIKRTTIEKYGWENYCENVFTVKIME